MSTLVNEDLLNLQENESMNILDTVSAPSNIAQKIDTMSKFHDRVSTTTAKTNSSTQYIKTAITLDTISFSEFSTEANNNQVGLLSTNEFLEQPTRGDYDTWVPSTIQTILPDGYNKGLLDYLRLAQDNKVVRPIQVLNNGQSDSSYWEYHNLVPGIFSPINRSIETIMDAGPHNIFRIGNLLTGSVTYKSLVYNTDQFKVSVSNNGIDWKTLYLSPSNLVGEYLHEMSGQARYIKLSTLTKTCPNVLLGSSIVFADGDNDFSSGPGSYYGTNAWDIKVLTGNQEVFHNQNNYCISGIGGLSGIGTDSVNIGLLLADDYLFELDPSLTDAERLVKRIDPDITGGMDTAGHYRDSQILPLIGGSECLDNVPSTENNITMIMDAGRNSAFKSDFITTGYKEVAGVKEGTTPFSVYTSMDQKQFTKVYESTETTYFKKIHSVPFTKARFVKLVIHSDVANNLVPSMYFNVQYNNLNLFGWKPWDIEIYYDKISWDVAKTISRLGDEDTNFVGLVDLTKGFKGITNIESPRYAQSYDPVFKKELVSKPNEIYQEVLDAGPQAKFDFADFSMITGYKDGAPGSEVYTSPFMIYGTDDENILVTEASELNLLQYRLIYSNDGYLNNINFHESQEDHQSYRFMIIVIPVPDATLNNDNIGRILFHENDTPFTKMMNLGVSSYKTVVQEGTIIQEIVNTDESIHFLLQKLTDDAIIPSGQNGVCVELDTNGYNLKIEEGSVLVAL